MGPTGHVPEGGHKRGLVRARPPREASRPVKIHAIARTLITVDVGGWPRPWSAPQRSGAVRATVATVPSLVTKAVSAPLVRVKQCAVALPVRPVAALAPAARGQQGGTVTGTAAVMAAVDRRVVEGAGLCDERRPPPFQAAGRCARAAARAATGRSGDEPAGPGGGSGAPRPGGSTRARRTCHLLEGRAGRRRRARRDRGVASPVEAGGAVRPHGPARGRCSSRSGRRARAAARRRGGEGRTWRGHVCGAAPQGAALPAAGVPAAGGGGGPAGTAKSSK